jgi:hypothetical protein
MAVEFVEAIAKQSEDFGPDGVPLRNLHPEDLDGQWWSEVCKAEGQLQKRVLEIKALALALNTLDSQGRVCSRAQGHLKLLDTAEADAINRTGGAELAAGI